MFNENSSLVQLWARKVKEGVVTREQVPQLSNLREMVYAVLDAEPAIL